MITKRIIKNLSGVQKQILNRDVADGEYYDIPPHLWLELMDNTEVLSLISSGDYVVNDGYIDLSPDAGILHIQWRMDIIHEPVQFSNIIGDNVPRIVMLNSATYGLSFDIENELYLFSHLDNPIASEDISIQLHLALDNTLADRWVQFEITFLSTTGILDKQLNTHDAIITTSKVEVPTDTFRVFDIKTKLTSQYFQNGEDNIFLKIKRINILDKTSPINNPILVRVDQIYRRERPL